MRNVSPVIQSDGSPVRIARRIGLTFALAAAVAMPGAQAQAGLQAASGPGPRIANPLESIELWMSGSDAVVIENPAALIPFYEQLYRHQNGHDTGPVRILQYGDSHTAADIWTAQLRYLFQQQFGDGGSGYVLAGKPWRTYRHENARTSSSEGWYTNGLVGRYGDGADGLAGISMSASHPGEFITVETEAEQFELFYWKQPGGGALSVYDNGQPLDLISTAPLPGEAAGPGYYRLDVSAGLHRFELRTLDEAPVRLYGWTAENPTGVTYEVLGINGAQAVTTQRWDLPTLEANLHHRDPALIVLQYGTNDAGSTKYTLESYREMFAGILANFRAAAPTASILVLGPPDRSERTRRGWRTMQRIEMIAEAQRQAALASGVAYLDLQAAMGGPGSMLDWAQTELAQNDHVHFSRPGYRLLGEAMFRGLVEQYGMFLDARRMIMAGTRAAGPGQFPAGMTVFRAAKVPPLTPVATEGGGR